jgi:hypothetical protein
MAGSKSNVTPRMLTALDRVNAAQVREAEEADRQAASANTADHEDGSV